VNNELVGKVRDIVAAVFNKSVDEITIDSGAKDIQNWDSLNLINLMLSVESEFNVEIGIEQAGKLTSVKTIIEILEQKGIS